MIVSFTPWPAAPEGEATVYAKGRLAKRWQSLPNVAQIYANRMRLWKH